MNNKRTFLQYVIPSVLSFALSGVYAIVDGFFVGNSIGDAGLSAINIAYPITAVLQSVGIGIGMGGSVKYSILKAAGNEKKAREFVADATWLMLLFSAVLTVTVFFTSEKILSDLGASGELLTLGNEYIKVIALGAILQVFGTGLVPFMRNYGGSLWAMIAMICGFATNIALDYTFVWVLGRGMYGAACQPCVFGIKIAPSRKGALFRAGELYFLYSRDESICHAVFLAGKLHPAYAQFHLNKGRDNREHDGYKNDYQRGDDKRRRINKYLRYVYKREN